MAAQLHRLMRGVPQDRRTRRTNLSFRSCLPAEGRSFAQNILRNDMTINFRVPTVRENLFHSNSSHFEYRGLAVAICVTIEVDGDGYCPSIDCFVENEAVNIHALLAATADFDATHQFCDYVRGEGCLDERWYVAVERALDAYFDVGRIAALPKQVQ